MDLASYSLQNEANYIVSIHLLPAKHGAKVYGGLQQPLRRLPIQGHKAITSMDLAT